MPAMTAAASPARRAIATTSAALAIIVGGSVLLGWHVGWDLAALADKSPIMTPNTAFGLLLLGIALLLRVSAASARAYAYYGRVALRILLALTLVLALLTLWQYVTGMDLGIDDVLAPDSTSRQLRPSPRTALEFLLLTCGLGLSTVTKSARVDRWSEALLLLALLPPALALVGHLYSMQPLYAVSPDTGMAIHSAAVSLVLALGALCSLQGSTVLDLLSSGKSGGTLARGVMPAVFGVPILLGWLQMEGQTRGIYDTASGISMFVIAHVAIFAALIWITAQRLEQEHQLREEAEGQFRAVAESASDAILVVDHSNRIQYANASIERILGIAPALAAGMHVGDLILRGETRDNAAVFTSLRELCGRDSIEARGVRSDATTVPIDMTVGHWDRGDEPLYTLIIRDISDRKSVEAQLQRRARQLESANQELAAFSYSASHDLRAPIRAIEGFATLLIQECSQQLTAAATGYLQRIVTAVRDMRNLIEGLLHLSRLSQSDIVAERSNLSDIASQVLTQLRAAEPHRYVDVRIADDAIAEGDPRMLRSLLQNLLGNAWKYTARTNAARIEFGVEHDGDRAVYFVRDNGVGFDLSDTERLFKPFHRLHSAAEFKGLGIGLATAKRIVDHHGGKIWAWSQPGQATEFRFTLKPGSTAARTVSPEAAAASPAAPA